MRPTHILILLIVLVILFGAKRLPDVARSVEVASMSVEHLKVADLARSLDFYCGLLGFEVTTTYGNDAAFISAGPAGCTKTRDVQRVDPRLHEDAERVHGGREGGFGRLNRGAEPGLPGDDPGAQGPCGGEDGGCSPRR